MATPKFSVFGYVKMEFIERKKKIYQILGNFFLAFSKWETPLKSENFMASYNILMGAQGSAMVW